MKTSPGGTDLGITPRILSFDRGNWDDPQTVTVQALHDRGVAADATATLEHTAFDRDRTKLDRENVVIVIEEDYVPEAQPAGPRWLSSFTEFTPQSGSGGRLEVRVLTLDTTSRPGITIDGPGLADTRRAGSCSLERQLPGYVRAVTCCRDAVFNLPVNDNGSTRIYTVTAESTGIAENLVTAVSVSPTPSPETEPSEQTASVAEAVVASLTPLGRILKWALHFNNDAQEWLDSNPGSPSAGTLNQLVPGQVSWLGVGQDQTAVLGGASRTLKTGLNQLVW